MERSDYWRLYTRSREKENRGWPVRGFAGINPAFTDEQPVFYGGRFLALEVYLEVPTFRRLGRRLVV